MSQVEEFIIHGFSFLRRQTTYRGPPTNVIESAFFLLKRGVVGPWHKSIGKTSSGLPARRDVALPLHNRKNQYPVSRYPNALAGIGQPGILRTYKGCTAALALAAILLPELLA
jgi:hypothetical protein